MVIKKATNLLSKDQDRINKVANIATRTDSGFNLKNRKLMNNRTNITKTTIPYINNNKNQRCALLLLLHRFSIP
jgi:hypothetical protein